MIGLACVFLLATSATVAPILVAGDTDCPTPSEVDAALVGLVAPPVGAVAPDVVGLTRQGPWVSVRLSNPAGVVIAEKRLPPALSCGERAQAAAVIVAAWEARLRSVAGSIEAPTTPMTDPVPVPFLPPGSPSPPPHGAARRPGAESDAATTQPRMPTPDPIRIETGATLLASLAAGEIAPAALLEVTVFHRDSRFALGVGAVAVGTHSVTLASGRGAWRRLGGVLELQSSQGWGSLELQMHAGLALAALAISGESFPATSGATILDPGLLAGLRLRLPGRRLSPWLEAAAVSWPRTHVLSVEGTSASTRLPSFEVWLGAGLSFGDRR